MKKFFLLASLTLVLASCGNDEKSVEQVIESEDLEAIRAKKAELSSLQSQLSANINKLDEKIRELDKSRQLPLVSVDTLKQETFRHYAEVQGDVATDENIIIYPEYSGLLTQVNVDEGDRVRKGQVLARIDDGGLSSQLAQLEAQASLAKTTYERRKRLWEQNIGSEIEYLNAKTNYESTQNSVNQMKSQISKTVVRAPFSGVIDEVFTENGEVVSPGQSQLFRLISLENMYVEADVPENYLTKIKKGTNVKIQISSIGEELDGKVSQVGNNINPNNRTFKVQIAIPNSEGVIKPNQIATIMLNDYTSEESVIIPESTIQKNAMGESLVYILGESSNDSTGVAQKVIVETGYTYNDSIEVTKGLQSGQILIIEGAKNLRDGQEIKFRK
ncbi:efflux RND transporter periplasmic adaptor subunit [Christiangramia flava]|uniref:Putative Co/Zn/Cd efflux system membrane fusion protein n=1 Tax=Christiangramia flava JLT2011 TaxID=1229726 RepID=A0A1L7I441_9FLAO|nr:efflux RND transporter periplasmic adaptor subunit [Christiangramia flava]APU67905.1 putative Co/Zn/Cd efflux system membrane fusion protein [Christiangramia flava JLT2011]OSS40407.1 Co/Zn/Cd efflux system membrane fusion protein [Christiangramia flava JLT2011]